MFSIKRFVNEFNAQFRLLSLRHGVILLIFTLWIILKHFIFFKYIHNASDVFSRPEVFNSIADPSFIIILVSVLISLDVFSKLRSPVGGIHYMMTPANTSEKFAAAWVYSTLLTFISFTLVYNLTHILCMVCGNFFYDLHAEIQFQTLGNIWYLFSGTMVIQSIYFFGSVFFRKNPVGKTTLILFAAMLLIGFGASWYFEHYLKESLKGFSHSFNGSADFEKFSVDMLPEELRTLYTTLKVLFYILPFVFWGGSFLALKNKEV